MHDFYLFAEVWIAAICYSIYLLQKQPFPGFDDYFTTELPPYIMHQQNCSSTTAQWIHAEHTFALPAPENFHSYVTYWYRHKLTLQIRKAKNERDEEKTRYFRSIASNFNEAFF